MNRCKVTLYRLLLLCTDGGNWTLTLLRLAAQAMAAVLFLLNPPTVAVTPNDPQAAIPLSISGTVLDPSSALIPGAEVDLTNSNTNATATITTDLNGAFRFKDLSPGK